ncbi:hypothetical protein AAG570_005436 [Ranatra chinensis]|uniref:Uncharacterized protein n=1 Tax=Ranatra chinensis TaxID=642074 RepID=A0ABD0XXF1_9HEMI
MEERCIVRNCLQTSLVNSQQWICFVCKKKDLWPHRALVWALISILNNMSGKIGFRKYRDPVWCTDVSTCCRKRKSPALEPEVTVRKLAPKLLPQTSNNNNNINSSSNTTNVYTVINNSPRVQVVQVAPPGQQFLAEPNTTVAAPYVDTRWFQMAANYLIDNIGVICEQIKDVRDSVSNYDTIANISTAVTSLCNLTTVAGQQLSKSSTTLKRDWKNRTGPTPNNLGVLHHALAQSAVQTPPAQVQPPPPPPPPPSPPKPPSPPPPPPPPPPPTQPTPVVSSLEKENVSANSNQKVTKKTTSARNGIAKKAKSRVRFSVPKPVSIPELLQRYKIRECKVVLNKCC